MSAKAHGLMSIFSRVNNKLLRQAFVPHPIYQHQNIFSLESLVNEEVIQKFVLPHCNLVTGEFKTISLDGLTYTEYEGGHLYRIPLNRTGGRIISSVVSIEGQGVVPVNGGIMGSAAPLMSTGTARAYSPAPNCVLITENLANTGLFINCLLENDEDLSNFNPRALVTFGELCVLAAKLLIVNKLDDEQGEGRIVGGSSSPYLRNALDSYRDSDALFMALLEGRWSKIALQQDPVRNRRRLRRSLPPRS